jgi:hypothetical protein
MFEPFLSCKAFGLSEGPPDAHVLLARWWSGQPSLGEASNGFVQWDSQTTLDIGGDVWLAPPPRMEFPAHNALIRLGETKGGVRAFAFVSPFPVVTASFRTAVSRYLRRARPGTSVVDLALQLKRIAETPTQFVIRSVEGIDQWGLHAVLTVPPSMKSMQNVPTLKEYHAIEIAALEHTARLDAAYNITFADISVEPLEVSKCLIEVFNRLYDYMEPAIH